MPAPKPTSSPPAWILPVVAIVLTAVGLWWWQGRTSAPPPARVVATQPATPATTPDAPAADGTPRQGMGLFAHADGPTDDPSARKHRRDRDGDDDLPLPGQAGHRAKRPRRNRDPATTGKRNHDRHTIFSGGETSPYTSGKQTTLDDVRELTGDAGTVSFWILPIWGDHLQDDAALITFGNDIVRIFKNVTFLRYEAIDDRGGITGLGVPIVDWQPGEWHQVVATWDGRVLWFYVDGALISTAPQSGPISLPEGTPIHIGSNFPANRPVASAIVANVSIRDRALNPTAVTRRFMTGPPSAPPPGR